MCMCVGLAGLAGNATQAVSAAEPLHLRIDRLLESRPARPHASIVDDATFLRRIYLDLLGRIPSASELRGFLADKSPNKRDRVIDALLAHPGFSRHLAATLDVMLMERRGGKHVKSADFRTWLRTAIDDERSYLDISRRILSAGGDAGPDRAAAAFFLERDLEPNLVTREIGRMFFGQDLQCCQCHDHPLIDGYLQEDYYGLYAFVNRTSLHQPDKKKPALLAESAEGDAQFKSVFTDREAIIGPRLPGGREVADQVFAPGTAYQVKPAKNVRAVPKYSRRSRMAEIVAAGANPMFNRNIVNRLWAMMLGRGIVHPVDQLHPENTPAIPELLDLLADEFVTAKFDIRTLLREIARTHVYQSQLQLTGDLSEAVAVARQLTTDLPTRIEQANQGLDGPQTSYDAALEKLDKVLAEAKPVRAAYRKAYAAGTAAAKKHDEAVAALAGKRKALAAKQPLAAQLVAALNTAQSALKLLNQDKELASAVALIKKRSDATAAAVTKLNAEITKAVQNEQATAAKLAENHKLTAAEQAKFAPVEQRVRQQQGTFLEARAELDRQRSRVVDLQHELQHAQRLVAFDDIRKNREQIRQQLPSLMAQHAKQQQLLKAVEARLRQVMADHSRMRATYEAAQKERKSSLAQLQAKKQAAPLLRASVSAASRAQSAAPNDEDVTRAANALKQVGQTFERQLAAAVKREATQRVAYEQAKSAFDQVSARLRDATNAVNVVRPTAQAAERSLEELTTKQRTTEAGFLKARQEFSQQVSDSFQAAVVDPLTPEQLVWSLLESTGQLERQRLSEQARLQKEKPLNDEQLKDAVQVAARQRAVDEAAHAKLQKTVNTFVKLYGNQTGQPQDAFFATVDQALFLANGGELSGWLTPAGDNLTARLAKLETAEEVAEELYVSAFSRSPEAAEVASVKAYLEQRKDQRPAAMQEMAWALLTSSEFRFQR